MALNDVSINIALMDNVAIVGRSGDEESPVAREEGLSRPASGQAEFRGEDIYSSGNKKLGLLFANRGQIILYTVPPSTACVIMSMCWRGV